MGNDFMQPGGWLYNLLPYIEQPGLHDLGAGTATWDSTEKKTAHALRMNTAFNGINCPTRRKAIVYPCFAGAEMNYSCAGGGNADRLRG